MVYGIICEFNPFHSGHKYLIDSIKKDGDSVICVMSGNFVQRGEPAVYNKYERTRAALEGGADLVIELPTECAVQSAQGFAEAGVKLLESTGVCDAIAFGAECDNVDELKRISREIKEKDSDIKAVLKSGVSYPSARREVIGSPALDYPNNILAIEYLSCTSLPAVAVKRIGKGHDSGDREYSSSEIRAHLPEESIASLQNCENAVMYRLRTMNTEDFRKLDDVSEGLENRIAEAVKTAKDIDSLYSMIKTKRFTHSRIRRIILRAFLGIDRNTPKNPLYLHILGFNSKGRELLTKMKDSAELPLITRYGDARALGGEILAAYERECRYSDIYNIMYKEIRPCSQEQTAQLVLL